jgi:hypothetical protein
MGVEEMKIFDCEVIFDEISGECEFFIMRDCKDEDDALAKLYQMEPNYKNFKVNLYDITNEMVGE